MKEEEMLDAIISKFINDFKKSNWFNLLKAFLHSDDFRNIFVTLQKEVNDNKRFGPPLKYLFRAFDECDYNNLKVIIIGPEPFTGLNNPDGIAFSSKLLSKPHPVSETLLTSIDELFYKPKNLIYDYDYDLKRLSNQGVLLINCSLTSRVDNPNKHHKLWSVFMSYLIDMLNSDERKYVWVFMSSNASYYADLLCDKQIKLFAMNPASARFTQGEWKSKEILLKINKHVKRLYNAEIKW